MKLFILLALFSSLSYAKTLILIGGGKRPEGALREFVQRAVPNKKIVVLPWGTSYPVESFESIQSELVSAGAHKSQIICLCNEKLSSLNIAEIKNAGAIYFPGGNQNKIMQKVFKYNLKPVFQKLYDQDIPVAGTSAGTAIQTENMLTGVGSETAEGLGLLKGFIVDQHFHKRGREQRLLGTLKNHPSLHGLGIDEDMSVTITDNEHFLADGPSIISHYQPIAGSYIREDYDHGSSFSF